MKLGLLADIHERNDHLRAALCRFRLEQVDQVVVLGDVAATGSHLAETCRLLREARAVGVWGNHDYGLACDPGSYAARNYSGAVLAFMTSLRPRLEIEGCLFTHVEPWLDTEKLTDLWYFEGPPDTPQQAARTFRAVPHRYAFIGHLHRPMIFTPAGRLDWPAEEPLCLNGDNRYLVVVGAVCDGRYAIFDTRDHTLHPFQEG